MSGGEDDLFTRWSRRKQAVRLKEAEEAAAAEEQAALPATDPEPEEPSVPNSEDPEQPVPSLDDLTPDGDLSAFMRGGVSPALRNAAMRKMWSLDPAIRDHVGLAENSWNFNEPGAMPGFGPLAAGRAVVGFLSSVTRETPAGAAETPTAEAPSPALESAAPPEPVASPPPEESVDRLDMADDPGEATTDVAAASEPAEAPGDAESARPLSRPRHGSALPR